MRRDSGNRGNTRGLSSVMGVALIFGIVIAASMVIVGVGAVSLSESQSTVSMESAVTAMNEIDAKISSVRAQSGSQTSLTLPDEGEYVKSGWVRVEVLDSSGSVQNSTRDITLGKIVYKRDGQRVAYQGGGVWRGTDDSHIMVSPPDFEYSGAPNPTLSFPITSLEGMNATGGSYTIAANQSNNLTANAVPQVPIGPGQTVSITVKSKYADAWADYLRNEAAGDVNMIDKDKVQLTLESPASPAAASGAVSSTGSVTMDPRSGMDYYDSNNGPYPGSLLSGDLPTTVVRGDYTPRANNRNHIYADVAVSGVADIQGAGPFVIEGDFRIGGTRTTKIQSEWTVKGDFSTRGNIETRAHPKDFEEDVYVGGDLDVGSGASVQISGDLHVQGDITGTHSNLNVAGETHVGGNSGPISPASSNPDTPLDPNIKSVTVNDPVISNHANAAASTNDNADESGDISDIESGKCSKCTLEEGVYHLNGLDLNSGDKLILDTSNGPIEIVVRGKSELNGGNLTVIGSNQAEIYSTGDVSIKKQGSDPSKVVTRSPKHKATALTWYMASGEQFTLKASYFTGLLDAPRTDIVIQSGGVSPEVHGAMIGDFTSVTKSANFHFDNALTSSGSGSGLTGASGDEIDYLRVTNPSLDIRAES